MIRASFALFIVAAVAAVCLAESCGGNNPCGGSNPQDIASWCGQFGDWSQSCCQCIVSHESGGDASACNLNTNGSYDIGLWQINDYNWNACNGGNAPCDPSANLNCAIDVWRWGGGTWKFWSTCGMCGCCGSA